LRQSDGDKEEQELSAVPDPAAPVPSAYRAEVADGVLRLTFTRPEAGNAIPTEAVPGLKSLVQGINADPLVRAVLVRGEGANFSAGGDLKGFERGLSLSPEERRADFERRLAILGDLVAAFLTLEVPVVAACRGGIAGAGLMYALGADVVMVDDTAKFIFAQQRIGLTPDGGISHLLPRIVGLRRASQLILTGAVVGAAEALDLGLVSRIVASADLDAQAEQQAVRLAQSAQGAIRRAKRLLAGSMATPLIEQLKLEQAAIADSVVDPDFAEGVRAALGKRRPVFPSAADLTRPR